MTSRRRTSAKFTLRDRRALFLMSIVAFVSGYGASTISHTLPFARNALDLSEGAMFWIFGITRAVSLLGLLFAIAADRTGTARSVPVCVCHPPHRQSPDRPLLPNPVMFAVTQSVTRVGVVAVAALAVVILAEELTPELRALGIGIYALAGSMGAGLGLLILPLAESGARQVAPPVRLHCTRAPGAPIAQQVPHSRAAPITRSVLQADYAEVLSSNSRQLLRSTRRDRLLRRSLRLPCVRLRAGAPHQ